LLHLQKERQGNWSLMREKVWVPSSEPSPEEKRSWITVKSLPQLERHSLSKHPLLYVWRKYAGYVYPYCVPVTTLTWIQKCLVTKIWTLWKRFY
jgi:hypothetical protein